jgi:hypothetical protein
MITAPLCKHGWLTLFVVSALDTVGCAGSSEAGTRVQLVSTGAALSEGQMFSPAADQRLRVDALHWTSAEVELVPCRSAWQRAAEWLVPTAHAHGFSTPTLMADPTVENAQTTADVTLGEMQPPAGDYCAVHYRMAAADDDATGVSAAPEMVGKSFLLRGAIGTAAAGLESIELFSTRGFDVTLPLALELTSKRRTAVIRFQHDASRWFEGLELDSLSPAEQQQVLLEMFTGSLSVEVE